MKDNMEKTLSHTCVAKVLNNLCICAAEAALSLEVDVTKGQTEQGGSKQFMHSRSLTGFFACLLKKRN